MKVEFRARVRVSGEGMHGTRHARGKNFAPVGGGAPQGDALPRRRVPAEVLIVPQRTRLAGRRGYGSGPNPSMEGRICARLRRVFRRRRNFAISAPRLRLALRRRRSVRTKTADGATNSCR
jgi:hypothetical protein